MADPSGGSGTFSYTPGAGTSGAAASATGFPVYIPGSNSLSQLPVPGMGTPGHISSGDAPGAQRFATDNISVPGQPTTFEQALLRLLKEKDEGGVTTLQERLIKAGYLDPTAQSFVPGQVGMGDETYNAYAQAMTDSIAKGENFEKLLRSRIKNPDNTTGQKFWSAYQANLADAGNGGATTSTQTAESTNLSDPTQGRAAAQSQYEDLLGRNLNDGEASAFQSFLNSYEASHPNVTTQTTTSNNAANTSTSNTVSSGGASDPTQLAESYIMQHDGAEYAKTQGSEIYSLFASMLGGGA